MKSFQFPYAHHDSLDFLPLFQVGNEIFAKYIKKALKDKTVLLVTHGMQASHLVGYLTPLLNHSAIQH